MGAWAWFFIFPFSFFICYLLFVIFFFLSLYMKLDKHKQYYSNLVLLVIIQYQIKNAYFLTNCMNFSVEKLFGLSIGIPKALSMINCGNTPNALATPNKTV